MPDVTFTAFSIGVSMARSAVRTGMALGCVLGAMPTLAAAATLDGANLSAWWGLPFAGVLLSIALFPLLAPHVWHAHYGKIAGAWAVLLSLIHI